LFEDFTERARRVVTLAQEEARHLGHSYTGTEHILLGLLREDESTAAIVLEGSGGGLDEVRERVEGIVGQDDGEPLHGEVPFTPRSKEVFRLARREALRLEDDRVGTKHLLVGSVDEAEEKESLGVAARILVALGVDRQELRRRVRRELGTGK
jgi:ATP-dependent Clp protease ATP-binding subunit ClpC